MSLPEILLTVLGILLGILLTVLGIVLAGGFAFWQIRLARKHGKQSQEERGGLRKELKKMNDFLGRGGRVADRDTLLAQMEEQVVRMKEKRRDLLVSLQTLAYLQNEANVGATHMDRLKAEITLLRKEIEEEDQEGPDENGSGSSSD